MSTNLVVTDQTVIDHLKTYNPFQRPSKKTCVIGVHPTQPHPASGGVFVSCTCGNFWDEQCCTPACTMHGCGARKGCKCPVPAINEEGDPPLLREGEAVSRG